MEKHVQDNQPFDERAALEELERLSAHIQLLRSKRTDIGVQFEQFARSVRTTGRPPDVDVVAAPSSSPAIDGPPLEVAPDRDQPQAAPPAPQPSKASAARPRVTARGALIGGAVMLLAASGVVTWTLRKTPSQPPPADPGASAPAREPTARTQPIGPSQPSPTVPSRSEPITRSQSEIVTTQAAWVRIIADGERVLERELPPGTRVPVKAAKTLTIRTGNAGAVRVFIGGKDQGSLGVEGAVVTRTFSVPGR
jgi:hypothetical protein